MAAFLAGLTATMAAALMGTTILHLAILALVGFETSLAGQIGAFCFNAATGTLVAAPATLLLVPAAGLTLDEELLPPVGALVGCATVVVAVLLFFSGSPGSLAALTLVSGAFGGLVGWAAARVHMLAFRAVLRR